MVDADLGGGVIKKRVAAGGRGKRGALRTLLAYRRSDIVFFIFGFEKNERENIEQADLRALRLLAKHLLALDDRELKLALGAGELEELRSE